MERPLYAPISKPRLDSESIRPAGEGDETDPAALFEQVYVDPGPLRGKPSAPRSDAPAGRAGRPHRQRAAQPGVAELVTYLSLRDDAFTIVYDEPVPSRSAGMTRTATIGPLRLPRVTFTSSKGSAA